MVALAAVFHDEQPPMKMQCNSALQAHPTFHHQQSHYIHVHHTHTYNQPQSFDPALNKQVTWEYRHALTSAILVSRNPDTVSQPTTHTHLVLLPHKENPKSMPMPNVTPQKQTPRKTTVNFLKGVKLVRLRTYY